MPLKFIILVVVCAAALYLYLQFRGSDRFPRLRSRRARARRDAIKGPASEPLPERGIVDTFLFEQSFGWELARVLLASLPVVLALVALYWLARNMP